MNFLWLGCLWLATVISVTSSQDTDKRAPKPNAFAAMRGKKDFDYDSGFYYDKRVPMGFAGVRGKKLSDDYSSFYESKRAPSRSFFAVKGKRELLTPDLSSLLDDIQVPDMDKRAPARFFGMRGKKGPSSQSFFGMRGKKDYDLEPYWYSRAGYSDDLSQLLNVLNAPDTPTGRAKRDVSDMLTANSLGLSSPSQHSADN
uniref:TK n=1 Tax=Diaphorina citri TaxID=121845 RepID=A0A2U9PFT0_DIACI|nr:TK [Diaphorina citri]